MTRNFVHPGLATTIVLALSAPAFAGGLNEPIATPVVAAPVIVAAPMAVSADWSGFYAGAQLGYGMVSTDAVDEEPQDLTYGIHAGYLADLGSIVLGGEVDYDMTEIGFTTPAINLESVARLKLRVGYDAGAFLPYAVAGLAQAELGGAVDDTVDGMFGGVGVDYQLNDSLRVGGEVLVHQFEDALGAGVNVDATTFALRASYNF